MKWTCGVLRSQRSWKGCLRSNAKSGSMAARTLGETKNAAQSRWCLESDAYAGSACGDFSYQGASAGRMRSPGWRVIATWICHQRAAIHSGRSDADAYNGRSAAVRRDWPAGNRGILHLWKIGCWIIVLPDMGMKNGFEFRDVVQDTRDSESIPTELATGQLP
jgi:hypothetical protein